MNELNDGHGNLFEAKERIGLLTNERSRVNKLFSVYSRADDQKSRALIEMCKSILSQSDACKNDSVGDNLYAVRCLVIHKYYAISGEIRKKLDDLNKAFLDVIFDILLNFKLPKELSS